MRTIRHGQLGQLVVYYDRPRSFQHSDSIGVRTHNNSKVREIKTALLQRIKKSKSDIA